MRSFSSPAFIAAFSMHFPKLYTRMNPMRIARFGVFVFAVIISFAANAQTFNIGTDLGGGSGYSYTNHLMTDKGSFWQKTIQENFSTSAGSRKWEINADSYFNTWRAPSGTPINIAGHNSVIAPNSATASAFWRNNYGGGDGARFLATTSGNYYTINITAPNGGSGDYANQHMQVLETTFNPINITAVSAAAGTYGGRLITITTSATPGTGENIYIRYSTNSFASSTIIQATGSGTTWTATIPWQSSAVSYYVYTSNKSLSAINSDVSTFGQFSHDLATLNLNNNSGSNYSWTPLSGNIIVTSTSGTAANTPTAYTSFTTATTGLFAVLNTGTVHSGTITVLVTANITETGTTTLNNSAAWTSLGIQPSGAVTLSSAQTVLFSLAGADNVTIDGRIGGTGSTKSLTFSNTSTSGTAFTFSGDATSNTVRYCTVQGVNTSTTSGVIVFTTGTTTGNDNNTIDFCDVKDGATTPNNCIYASGSTGTTAQNNSGVTISNCNIYNFFNATSATNGISVQGGNTDWTISGNSIYQTATRTFTSGANHAGIIINNSSGNNFVISGNYVGGGAALCGGTAWTYNGATTNRYRGISLTVGTTTASSVQGNTVANINGLTTSGSGSAPGTFAGIYVSAGSANIGTVTGNTIGSGTGTGSITMTLNTNNGVAYGIVVLGTTINVSNNIIGSITTLGNINSVAHGFVGISSQGTTTFTANNNTIGSAVTANSINCSNISTSTTAQTLHGIEVLTSATTVTIQNNTIANLTNAYAGSGTGGGLQTRGIYCAFGVPTITGNTIYNISTASTNTSGTTAAALNGITLISTISAGATVSQNTIHSLNSTGASGAIVIYGIYYNGATTGTNVIARNNIHSFSLASSSTTAQMIGLYLGGGNTTVQNNMVRLGLNAAGASITNTYDIQGISDVGTTNNYYFNSVYIGGTGVTTGTTNTFAFTSSVTTNTRAFQNNIFFNARSNSTGTGTHFAIRVGGTAVNPAGLTSNYNVLFANGTGGAVGQFNTVTRASLGDWQAATGQDANSINGNPSFLTPNGTSSTVDLHVNSAGTPIESAGILVAAITDDFDGQTRSGLTPTDIGADAGTFTAIDASAPSITFSTLSTPVCASASAQTLTATITDATGVSTTGSLVPRLYYKVGAAAYTSVAGTLSSGSGTNGTWTFSIPAQSVSASTTVSYYVIAQDLASTPNIGSNAGGVVATDVNTVSTHPSSANTYVVNPSLSGNYNVGSGQTFTTLTAAVAAYNSSCLAGPVTFTLTDASYTTGESFPITINNNTGASSTNTLTIKPSLTNTTISGSSTSAIIVLNGADWVRLDGSISSTANTVCPASSASRDLTIANTSTSTTSAVVWVQNTSAPNSATNNIISNCNLNGSGAANTLFGVGCGSSTIATNTIGNANNNNSYINNNITAVQYGIFSMGASTSNRNTGTVINQNLINTTAAVKGGIWVGFDNGVTISGNTISNISSTGSPDVFAISCGFGTSFTATTTAGNEVINATITNNTIGSVVNSGAFSAYGIGVSTAASGTTLIANNTISGVASNGTGGDIAAGIALGGGAATTQVYHNSVSMSGTMPAGSAGQASACLWVTASSAPILDIRNNIFSNTQNGGAGAGAGTKFCAIGLVYTSTAGNYVNLTSNYNDLYSAGAGPGTYMVGVTGGVAGTARTTLNDWQTATGRDANSISVTPGFVSTTNLHSTSSSINNAGTAITAVTTDIDCESRSTTTPDIGADEFSIATDDAGVTALNAGTPCPGSSGSVTATIFNYGAATLTSVDVTWSVDGGSTTTQSFTGLSIAGGASGTVTITGVTFSNTVTAHSMTASTSLPNGNVDANAGNNSFTNSAINNQLSGTYTVCAAGNFTTIPLALARAASVGLCGATTFELIDASYTATSTIVIGQYTGVSATNTLTIKPATGVTTAITGAASITPIITFDGADYVILDGSNGSTANTICPASAATRNLTITSNSTSTTGAVVWLQTGTGTNSATNNTIKNCIIVGNSNTTTLFGIGSGSTTVSATSLGTSNNNNSIINNSISKAQYGIYSHGASSATKNSGTTINQNTITSSGTNAIGIGGIYVGFENNITISGNTISEISRAGDCFAMSIGYGNTIASGTTVTSEVTNATISNNIIGNITASGALSATGIMLGAATSGTSLISNNMIYGVSSNATPSDFSAGIVIGGGTGSTTNIYNNTVAMQGTQPTGTASAFSACLWVSASTAPVLDIRNNVFTNTQAGATGSTTKFAAIATNYTSVAGNYANLTSDDNILYAAGAGPGTYTVGITGGANRTTLNAWQTETGRDASSFSVLPVFVSATNLHLDPAAVINLTLDATATSGLTTTDIECDTRSATPDMGADEFTSTVSADDAGVTAIIVPTPLCPGMTTVQATITNYGSAPITSVLVGWSVNGIGQVTAVPTVNIPVLGSQTVTLGSFNFPSSSSAFTIAANTSSPNGNTDGNSSNDGYSVGSLFTSLSGTYAVGVGGDFTTLTAAVAAANTVGVCGSTVFNLTDASYSTSETFPITINALTGASATNTLTIKPTGNTTITGSSTSALIVLNGADYITIDGSSSSTTNSVCPTVTASRNLTLTNTNTSTSSAVIWLQSLGAGSGATNNTIQNVIAVGNSSTTTLACIGSGSSTISTGTTGADNDNNLFINNLLSKAQIGILSQGAGTSNYNTGTKIFLNTTESTATNNIGRIGIYVGFEDAIAIHNNTITNISGSSSDAYGISLGATAISVSNPAGNQCINALVDANVITTVRSSASAMGIATCTTTSAGPNRISNNMITDVLNTAASADYGSSITVGGGAGGSTEVYNNTVYMTGTVTDAAARNYALSIQGTNPIVDIKNNIFVNTISSTATFSLGVPNGTTCIGLAYNSPFTNLSSNNNAFYVTTGGNVASISGLTNANPNTTSTLSGWQSTTGADFASISGVNPVFVSSTDLHLDAAQTSNYVFNAVASNIATITTDIDCDTRVNPYDLGADEFFVPNCSGAIGGTATAAVTQVCGASGSTTITATGYSPAFTGITYSWEISNDGISSWSATGGTNPASFSTGTITATRYYRLAVTCSVGSVTSYSNVVSLVISPTPTASASSNTPLCVGSNLNLTGTTDIGTTFSWTGPNSFASSSQNPSVLSVTTAAAGTYSFVATSAAGCPSATATTVVVINANPVTPTITPSSAAICEGGNTVLTASISGANFTATQGSGASTSTGVSTGAALGPNPMMNYYGGEKQQMLFTAAELTALGLTSGSQITAIGFTLPSANTTYALQNYVVKMANSSLTNLSASWETSLTTVRTAANYTPVVGLNTLTLTTPFTWNGTSSLVIEVNYSNNNTGNATTNTAQYDATSFVSTRFYRVDSQTSAVVDAFVGTPSFTYSSRNKTTFTVVTPYTYAWSPTTNLTPSNGIGASVTAAPTTTTPYTVTATNSFGCSSQASATVTVNTLPTGAISGTASICAGESTNLTLTVTGSGTISGTLSSGDTFSGTAPTITVSVSPSGTTVYTIATLSDANCSAISGGLTGSATVTVNPLLTPSVSIAASPSNTICTGDNVTFTATPTNGGSTPSYQWYIGASPVGTNSNTYSSSSLSNGNVISVVMTSNAVCPSPTTATSNTVTMTVNAITAASVSIAANVASPICAGTSVTFTATPTGGGSTPSYQWYVGASPVGTNSATFTTTSLTNGNVVSVQMTSSAVCPNPTTATSNTLTYTVTAAPTWYQDADNDGYTSGTTLTQCAQPTGYKLITNLVGGVASPTDCNDSNEDVNPGADEWCNGVDDNCISGIDEGLGTIAYYIDADGDGYGFGTAVVACAQPVGYVLNNNDCNDALFAVNPAATEICDGINNDCDAFIDEGCGPINDEKATALPLTINNYSVSFCSMTNGTLAGAQVSPEALTSAVTGEDVWYYFSAPSSGGGLSIQCTSTVNNILLELHNANGTLVDSENVQSTIGNEHLNIGSLTAGADYYLCVRNYNSAQGAGGAFSLCLKQLSATTCFADPYELSLCSQFKVGFTGGAQFVYHFGSGITFSGVYSPPPALPATGRIVLNTVPGLSHNMYFPAVWVDAVYALTDGAGNLELTTVPGTDSCALTILPHTDLDLRAIDQNIIPTQQTTKPMNSFIGCTPYICGVTSYDWSFRKVDLTGAPTSLDSVVINPGVASAFIRLNAANIPGIQPGDRFRVKIRPRLLMAGNPTPVPGEWGTDFQYVRVTPPAGMTVDSPDFNYDIQLFEKDMAGESFADIYPNPNSGEAFMLNVVNISSGTTSIRIYDSTGKLIHKEQFNIETGIFAAPITPELRLNPGIHLVEITLNNGEVMTKKLVVQ